MVHELRCHHIPLPSCAFNLLMNPLPLFFSGIESTISESSSDSDSGAPLPFHLATFSAAAASRAFFAAEASSLFFIFSEIKLKCEI